MTLIREGLPTGAPMRALGTAIAETLRSDRRAGGLSCSIVIGVGALDAYSRMDARPRIVVPLAWPALPNEMGCAQIREADAIVAIDDAELAVLRPALPQSPVPVVVSVDPGARHSYLSGATTFDAIQAATTINSHPELAAALTRAQVDLQGGRVITAIATATLEAAVAAGALHG